MYRALMFAAVVSACSPPTPQFVCGPSNCSGCCVGTDICDTGTADSRCGKGGAACSACSGAAPLCTQQKCDVEPMPANAKLVFVTRATYSGNLGGLSGADSLCAAAAAAGSLPGTYRAWLSSTSGNGVNAFDRIQGTGPWYLPGTDASGHRTLVFSSKAALRAAPLAAIERTELGAPISSMGSFVWTGTAATGNASVSSCQDWTVEFSYEDGDVGSVYGGEWTSISAQSCSRRLPLYCFQQ